jgi:hypothetical protein
MSIAVTLHGASAPLDHRLGRGDGQAMLMAAPSALRSPQSPSCTHIHSRPLATIPSANSSTDLIHTAPIPSATTGPIQIPIASHRCTTDSSYPAVSSLEAYQTPTADRANLLTQR